MQVWTDIVAAMQLKEVRRLTREAVFLSSFPEEMVAVILESQEGIVIYDGRRSVA